MHVLLLTLPGRGVGCAASEDAWRAQVKKYDGGANQQR
jgi:hypothetical protein